MEPETSFVSLSTFKSTLTDLLWILNKHTGIHGCTACPEVLICNGGKSQEHDEAKQSVIFCCTQFLSITFVLFYFSTTVICREHLTLLQCMHVAGFRNRSCSVQVVYTCVIPSPDRNISQSSQERISCQLKTTMSSSDISRQYISLPWLWCDRRNNIIYIKTSLSWSVIFGTSYRSHKGLLLRPFCQTFNFGSRNSPDLFSSMAQSVFHFKVHQHFVYMVSIHQHTEGSSRHGSVITANKFSCHH